MERLGGNDRATADPNSTKATSRNLIVECRPAKAGGLTGFPNAVTDLRGIVFDGLLDIGPVRPARRCDGLHGTTSKTTANRRTKPLLSRAILNPWKERGFLTPRNSVGISSLLASGPASFAEA